MTTWTYTSRSSAPTYTYSAKSDQGVNEANLLIGGGYKLLIGGGYFLTIQPSVSGTTWNYVSKS